MGSEANQYWNLQKLSRPPHNLEQPDGYLEWSQFVGSPGGGSGITIFVVDGGINPNHVVSHPKHVALIQTNRF